ncbi:phycobilisome protein [Egbenema bharatensis]|uniref:phycobilisome protein n=1 Tax=Egbenema bharatensis TaxID=3463334 RepID=UPI003A8860AB
MLSQFEHLERVIDGRYATDAELQFITDYVRSFQIRFQTYLKLQELELMLLQQTYRKIQLVAPDLLRYNNADMSAKWKQDTIRVLRYTAITVLLNDPDTLKERLLLWFRSVMQAFGTERSCDMTYQILQSLICQHLPPNQAELVIPVLELNRQMLGSRNEDSATHFPDTGSFRKFH